MRPDDDRLDFDAWLLAPIQADAGERFVRGLSRAAGPVMLFVAVAAGSVALF